MAISSLLLTARDALFAHRLAIDVTGGNVANVNTPGYTLQRIDLRPAGNTNTRDGNTQVGVAINGVERIYNSYIDAQVIAQQQNSSYSDTLLQGLQNIERIFDETNGNGINDRLSKFWSAWENLAKNPTGIVERNHLLSASKNLVEAIHSYKGSLDTINTDTNRSIVETISQINTKVDEIRDLNDKIFGTGYQEIETKNTLLDIRSQTLKELSALINIRQLENADGTIDVYLANGEPLVQGKTSQLLTVELDVSNQQSNISIATKPSKTLNETITSSKLGALLEMQKTIIPKYVNYLNTFSTSLATKVNELHTSGYDAYKNVGREFFTVADTNNPSGTIGINSIILADPNRIAASETVNADGAIAANISAVQNELLMNSGTATLNSYIAAVVGEIGSQVADATIDNDYQTVIKNQLENQRESVSGVSIDEEMIQLIKYQMGYTAAGKLVVSAEEMLDTLIDLIR